HITNCPMVGRLDTQWRMSATSPDARKKSTEDSDTFAESGRRVLRLSTTKVFSGAETTSAKFISTPELTTALDLSVVFTPRMDLWIAASRRITKGSTATGNNIRRLQR